MPLTADAAEATAFVVCGAWLTLPKSVVYVAPQDGSPGVPGTMPMPTSVNSGSRMLWRWPGLFIQAIAMLRAVARLPWPHARFSPTNQSPSGAM